MISRATSSRTRFGKYKQTFIERRNRGEITKQRGSVAPGEANTPRKRSRSFPQLFRTFLGLLGEHRGLLIVALMTLTVSTALGLVPPAVTKIVVDNVLLGHPLPPRLAEVLSLPTDPRRLLAVLAVGIVAISFVSITVGMTGRWLATRTTYRLKVSIRRRVFEHAMRLPLHRVYQLKSGGIASILNEDTGTLSDLVFSMIYNPCRAIIQLIGCLLVLGFVDWRLLVGSLILIPLVYLSHRTWISRIRPLYRDIGATRQEIDGQATEAFGGVRVVRSFSRAKSEGSRYVRGNHFRARQEFHVWWWSRAVDIAWAILIPAASAALMWYGGNSVLDGKLTVGDLMMFLTYLVMLLGPLETLAVSATQFQSGLAGLDRVLDVLHESREMPSKPGSLVIHAGQVRGRISFSDVSFAYPGSAEPVLRDVNLDIAPGELVALVGPSGAGKTTLSNLVARFYDPTHGAIQLDGTDLRDIDVESYRRLLGIVEQDIFLFDGTVADNIGYARRNVSMDQIVTAARQAHADEFIRGFEKGYDTVIGERGVRLSGGQRQRLAIARAILANPRILILDEATSNLDTASERLIQASLETLMRGRTTFVIAHRLSTVARADSILVLDHGHIIEQGTHEQLMARSTRYRQMVELQTHPVPMIENEATANAVEAT